MIETIREDLKRHEGCVLHAYQDHLGFWTIGIGRLIDKRRGGGLTQEEAEYLLDNDIGRKWNELHKQLPYFIHLPEQVQRALTNMAFQMGVPGLLKFKNTLRLIQAGRYWEAADNAMKSKWATQTPKRAEEVTSWIRSAE